MNQPRSATAPPGAIEEGAFLKHVKNTIKRTPDGRLQVRLPWREGYPAALRSNRPVAYAAVKSLEKTLRRKGITEEYNEEMKRIIKEYAEEVPVEELMRESAWYLQHFVVENKTKLRIVWNAAANYQGQCLNKGLEKGPNLLSNLLHVLLNFRRKRVAIQGDINKMFNQVEIHPQDRDYHRFVWGAKEYRWKRLPFGDKPAPDLCVYCLHHLAEENTQIMPLGSRVLRENTYMDDILGSCSSTEEASLTISEVDKILETGRFDIKGWHSNVRELETVEEGAQTTVLGIPWDKRADSLGISEPQWTEDCSTRRIVMSNLARVWDPLGMMSPLLVSPKVAMQELWGTKIEWDQQLCEEEREEWVGRFQILQLGMKEVVPRHMGEDGNNLVLHGFCDASKKAV